MKTYIKQIEIEEAKNELKVTREQMDIAYQRVEEYHGVREDIKEEAKRLYNEQIRLVDVIDALKDFGKVK